MGFVVCFEVGIVPAWAVVLVLVLVLVFMADEMGVMVCG